MIELRWLDRKMPQHPTHRERVLQYRTTTKVLVQEPYQESRIVGSDWIDVPTEMAGS